MRWTKPASSSILPRILWRPVALSLWRPRRKVQADLSSALLRLRGVDSEDWAGLIGRVKSGEIAKERTRSKDGSVVENARAAPTKCPTCGATLDVEIVRGMREITCEYCGSLVRL